MNTTPLITTAAPTNTSAPIDRAASTAIPTSLTCPGRVGAGVGDRGQATAEYALVILGAAALALLVIAWAANTSAVGDLMDAVLDSVRGRVG